MGNVLSAFTNEVFKPVVTLLIPGGIAIAPWFIGLMLYFPGFRLVVQGNHTETSWVVVLAMLGFGMVAEEFGTHLESVFDDNAEKASNGAHMRNWYAYLRTSFVADPVGRRYVRTLVLRLKFEFGILFSMMSAVFGILWLAWLGVNYRLLAAPLLLALSAILWSYWEAKQTHELLAENRRELLKTIRIVQ